MMSTQQQFLRFQLQPGVMALMEIDLVTELVNIPNDRIVPMPHLPPAVMGIAPIHIMETLSDTSPNLAFDTHPVGVAVSNNPHRNPSVHTGRRAHMGEMP